VSGTGLQLSLDSDLQYYAQQEIATQVKATRASSGTVIVMNPANGQVLALAVAPGFDPNHLATAKPADLGDPAITDPYEPGSVNKVITMSAGLEDGLVTPTSKFVIPPSLTVAGTPFHDAETHGTENLTLTGILAQSSNIGAIEVARELGAKRLDDYLKGYGFGKTTGLGLPGESAGILPPLSQWSGTTLPTLSFGQGVAVTAMQVASVYSTIANDGVRVTPNLVESTTDPQGHRHPMAPPARHRVISARVAAELRAMMESVISPQGTAPEARIPGYTVAGKTGTADRSNGRGGYSGYTASFVGMVPAEHPKLVCEVVLQQPRTDHFGGSVAGPVFHNVMGFALQTFGIAPTGTRLPKIPLTW
jgi:cell division protein FtsI (penicillin-binding protein 3)